MKTFIIFLATFIVSRGIALKVYNSNNVDLSNSIVSGLHYKKSIEEKISFSNSLTVCVRLKIRGLVKGYDSTKLLIIQSITFFIYMLDIQKLGLLLGTLILEKDSNLVGSWRILWETVILYGDWIGGITYVSHTQNKIQE